MQAIAGLYNKYFTADSSQPPFSRTVGFWSSPNDEKKTGFFQQLTAVSSQREDWYRVSRFCAEFWCSLSNAGFLAAGIKYRSAVLLFAGMASVASHTIPKQWLLTVDKIGAILVVAKFLSEYHVMIGDHPWLLAPLAATGVIGLMDVSLARKKGQSWPHVAWHLSGAATAALFLECSKR